MAVTYHHLDVFSPVAYAGNSLAVLVDPPTLEAAQMCQITRELRHFETIFVTRTPDSIVRARVFDLVGELAFAGHPVLGAAALLHMLDRGAPGDERQWTFALAARTVQVHTRWQRADQVTAVLDQGRPELVVARAPLDRAAIASALGLRMEDLDGALPPEILSTGLAYLVVPVAGRDALARARIADPDFETFLERLGAQFVYVLDAEAIEGRHWNNDGVIEDVATGSAAGCVAAYLMRHGRARDGEQLSLAQGHFVRRPSRIAITAYGSPQAVERVTVGGAVTLVGTGTLQTLPAMGRT